MFQWQFYWKKPLGFHHSITMTQYLNYVLMVRTIVIGPFQCQNYYGKPLEIEPW